MSGAPLRIEVLEGERLKENWTSLGQGDVLWPGMPAPLWLSRDLLSKHLLFVGSIGSGKTTAIHHTVAGIQAMLSQDDAMVVFDSKGDYVAEFRRPGDAVLSNGPDRTVTWNVFRDLRSAEAPLEETAFEVAKMLYHEMIERSQQPFFPRAASDLFASVLIALSRTNDELSNATLRALFDKSGLAEIRDLLAGYEDLRSTYHYVSSDKSPQSQGVMGETLAVVRETFLGAFRGEGDFSIQEFVRQRGGRTLFIEYDIAAGQTLTPIYRVLLDLALKEALGRGRPPGDVYFVFDEFALVPNLMHIDAAVNFGRSIGVKVIAGTQNVGQVLAGYGEKLGASVLSGFGTLVALRLFDQASRSFVQQRYGANRKRLALPSIVQSRGVMEEVVYGNVVEDWDLTRLDVGDAIISFPTGEPFRFRFAGLPSVTEPVPAIRPKA